MAKKRRLKKELEKMAGDIDFLMEHLKENGENSGAYMGTVLFLNEDSKEVEAALLGEILQAKPHMGDHG